MEWHVHITTMCFFQSAYWLKLKVHSITVFFYGIPNVRSVWEVMLFGKINCTSLPNNPQNHSHTVCIIKHQGDEVNTQGSHKLAKCTP